MTFVPTKRYATIAAAVARRGFAPEECFVVAEERLPRANVELPDFPERVLEWRHELHTAKALCWQHPLENPNVAPVTAEELEQLAGLLAWDVVIEQDQLEAGGTCLVATGRVRATHVALAWRWTFDDVSAWWRWRRILQGLDMLPRRLKAGLHLIEPARPFPGSRWSARVEHLMATLRVEAPGSAFGIFIPNPDDAAEATRVTDQLHRVASSPKGAALSCIAGNLTRVQQSMLFAQLAAAYQMEFDCTVCEPQGDRALLPYIPETAYPAQAFDARVPAYVRDHARIMIRYTPIASLLHEFHGADEVSGEALRQRLESRTAWERAEQLKLALDHNKRAEFHLRLEQDPNLVTEWHRHHVYNWAPPLPSPCRLLVMNAAELAVPQDPLLAPIVSVLDGLQEVMTAQKMFEAARHCAESLSLPSLREVRSVQVEAHRYLSEGGRPSLTADSAEIISVLPERLGSTLELGYGYGLLAKEIRSRATRYVGVDLETGQASSLSEVSAQGIVADVHVLPFQARCFDTVIADNVLEHAARPIEALFEIRRVLRTTGAAFVLIPLDGLAPDFQIRTHLWKADELSLREAARIAGFEVDLFKVLHYAELGVYGCFPASEGKTCLMRLHAAGEPGN